MPSKEQGKGPPETSSALAGRRKWWKGPERTKRAGAVSRTEDVSGAAGGCFWHRISLPYRRSLFFTPNASENASRTTGGLFEHGTHIRYRRGPFPVPSAVEGAGEGSAAAEPGALRQVAAAAEQATISQAR